MGLSPISYRVLAPKVMETKYEIVMETSSNGITVIDVLGGVYTLSV